MTEELESSQKACDYYQNDMIPNFKKNTEKLREEMIELRQSNTALTSENKSLKGCMDDKQKHYEGKNQWLQAKCEEQKQEIQDLSDRTDLLKEKLGNSTHTLNVKTQQSILQQEAIDAEVNKN